MTFDVDTFRAAYERIRARHPATPLLVHVFGEPKLAAEALGCTEREILAMGLCIRPTTPAQADEIAKGYIPAPKLRAYLYEKGVLVSHLLDLIRAWDELAPWIRIARDAVMVRLHAENPYPPLGPEPPRDRRVREIPPEVRAWSRQWLAQSHHEFRLIDEAERDPLVVYQTFLANTLASRAWELLEGVPILAHIPGGGGCPTCKVPCLGVPGPRYPYTAGDRLAICTADPTHVVEWLPWGG